MAPRRRPGTLRRLIFHRSHYAKRGGTRRQIWTRTRPADPRGATFAALSLQAAPRRIEPGDDRVARRNLDLHRTTRDDRRGFAPVHGAAAEASPRLGDGQRRALCL